MAHRRQKWGAHHHLKRGFGRFARVSVCCPALASSWCSLAPGRSPLAHSEFSCVPLTYTGAARRCARACEYSAVILRKAVNSLRGGGGGISAAPFVRLGLPSAEVARLLALSQDMRHFKAMLRKLDNSFVRDHWPAADVVDSLEPSMCRFPVPAQHTAMSSLQGLQHAWALFLIAWFA